MSGKGRQSKQAGAETKVPATNKEKQKASPLRHQRSIAKAIPVELLTTAITKRLILTFQIAMTAGEKPERSRRND